MYFIQSHHLYVVISFMHRQQPYSQMKQPVTAGQLGAQVTKL